MPARQRIVGSASERLAGELDRTIFDGMGGIEMRSDLKWSLGVCGFATVLAALLVEFSLDLPLVSFLGWLAFVGLLQLPILANSARGNLDPCTSWIRKRFAIGRSTEPLA